jgi:hypothetical protein
MVNVLEIRESHIEVSMDSCSKVRCWINNQLLTILPLPQTSSFMLSAGSKETQKMNEHIIRFHVYH